MEILCQTEAVAIKSQTLTGSRNVPRKLARTLPKKLQEVQEVHQIEPLSKGGKGFRPWKT